MPFWFHNLPPRQLLIVEARDELSETLADCACQCFPWTVLDTAYFGSLRETSPQKRSLPFSVTHLRFSSRHSVIPRDDSVGSVVPFATSWLQFALLNRNDLHAASRKSYGYYNSCACISSGGAAPFIQPASRFPDTYTASHTGPGEIGILFANCFSQQTFWYILILPGAFPGSLFGREDTTSSCQFGGSQGWVQLCSCRGPSRYKPSAGWSAGCSLHQVRLRAGSQPLCFLPPSRGRRLAFSSSLSLLASHTTNGSAQVGKTTSLQYLQISNRILTPAGFLSETYCDFQLGVIKKEVSFFFFFFLLLLSCGGPLHTC